MIEPFITAFTLALISEIADKTQLVILSLALKYRSPFKVFSGALLAHAFMDGIAILMGVLFGFSLSSDLIKNLTGLLFILLGTRTFAKVYSKEGGKEEKEIRDRTPLVASFLTVLLSEFGDKTQIASGLLAAKYLTPIPVFLGVVLALAMAIGLNVFVGSRIAQSIPRKKIKIGTAILFILFGMFTLLS
jgi:putative Ca2+/H+ antiporter (TMEM165/GDT1 family)